jgi:DNA-binding response OmpR family regulator
LKLTLPLSTLIAAVIESPTGSGRPDVFVLSTDSAENEALCSILSEGRFGHRVFPTLNDLEAGLKDSTCRAIILDVDSVAVGNRSIRTLKENFPAVSIFCTSERRFHPELQDALAHHISACLGKPVDPDELQFWLKAIDDKAPAPRCDGTG